MYVYYNHDYNSNLDYVFTNQYNAQYFYINSPNYMYLGTFYQSHNSGNNSMDANATAIAAGYYSSSRDLYNQEHTAIVIPNTLPRQLHTTRSPETGGGVASLPDGVNSGCGTAGNICCGMTGYDDSCQVDFVYNSNVVLKGFHNDGYAFYRWTWNNGANTATDNPHTFTMSGALGVTGEFKKTFRCASGDFYEPYDPQDPEIYGDGECVTYVRHETGADIYGNANTWYQGAINAGYYTTAGPSIPTGKDMSSAIIVFGIVSESSFPTGHVGIVINKVDSTHLNIRDANWNLDGKLDEHVIDVTNENYNILGYIYCNP